MPIRLAQAQDAMKLLQKCTGSELFDAMTRGQGYLFSKHTNKEKAREAARVDQESKGYFKNTVVKTIPNLAEYKAMVEDRGAKWVSDHTSGLPKTGKPPKAQNFGKGKNVELKRNISVPDFATLVLTIIGLSKAHGAYYEANANPDTRFLCITPMPQNYVGRTIDPEGQVNKAGLDHAVIIVEDALTQAPFILNLFPVNVGYKHGKTLLV